MEFADRSMEAVCYYAYWASTELAEERGRYSSLPAARCGTAASCRRTRSTLLREERGGYVEVDASSTHGLGRAARAHHAARHAQLQLRGHRADRDHRQHHRRRRPRIEPTYQNLYVKSNLSGEFTVVNEYLVRDLKQLGLWDEVMVADLKYFDGIAAPRSTACPPELRSLYATAFEVEPKWLVEAGARRQKWIDQAQSLNIYMAGASGKKLDETYKLAWLRGLKTTYYLRTMGATHAEKSTVKAGAAERGSSRRRDVRKSASRRARIRECGTEVLRDRRSRHARRASSDNYLSGMSMHTKSNAWESQNAAISKRRTT